MVYIDWQIDRDRQIVRQIDRQIDRKIARYVTKQYTCRFVNRQRQVDGKIDRQIVRQIELVLFVDGRILVGNISNTFHIFALRCGTNKASLIYSKCKKLNLSTKDDYLEIKFNDRNKLDGSGGFQLFHPSFIC